MGERPRAVIIGAGALGLGFLAERMAPFHDLCLADLESRAPLLRRIRAENGFTVNLCGADGMTARRVTGAFTAASIGGAGDACGVGGAGGASGGGHDGTDRAGPLSAALAEADLVLTAVGARALPDVVTAIAPVLNARRTRVWLLFCENGLDIAARYGKAFEAPVTPMDTVMSRMCRLADPGEPGYAPLWPDSGTRLVVEAHESIPLDRALCADGPFTPVFDLVSGAEFELWEDVKLFMHNGMHAFMSYHAFLEGANRFPDVSAPIRAEARRVMLRELVPAVMFHHPHAQREWLEEYGLGLLGRFVNAHFNDSIERGVRGAAEKLAPGERLLAGRDYIREAGIEPRGYATTIEAARRISELQQGQGAARA